MLGVMSSGSVIIPMDVQMDADTFCDCVSRSDEDVLFYDWDFRTLAEEAGSRCPALEECISFQHGRHVACSDNILKNYAGRQVENLAKPGGVCNDSFHFRNNRKRKGCYAVPWKPD